MELHGARVVVTGGASGLGRATAQEFRDAGARVCVFDLSGDAPAGIGFREVDVTDGTATQAAMDELVGRHGGIDVLVNCAGIAPAAPMPGSGGLQDPGTFESALDVNLKGTRTTARLAARAMAANAPGADGERGVIINTAPIAAFGGPKGQAAHDAATAGVAGLTLSMARELARDGIRVVTIAPGVFRTAKGAGLPEEVRTQLAAGIIFPCRPGDPAEFAALARLIVTCRYLNGATIRLDGGLSMD